jgi:hypothetical protein
MSMMSEKTEALLAQLASVELFHACGVDESVPAGMTHVSSWREALAPKRVRAFENVQLEAQGELTVELSKNHPARYNGRWNELVRTIRPRVIATFERRCTEFASRHGLDETLWQATRWNILGACMECEYADLVPATFYGTLATVYLAGHFPCGWSGGLYPAGHLEIY